MSFRTNNRCRAAIAFPIIVWLPMLVQASTCEPLGFDKAELVQLKEQGFDIADPDRRDRFAIELVDCLGDPDPQIRDGIAFEGFVTLLRGKQLQPDAIHTLLTAMTNQLNSDEEDQLGFRKPFLALALAEVARVDRIEPIFSGAERDELVTTSADFMRSIDDYRGFSEKEGWRHAVAHTADLQMQLTLNAAVTHEQLLRIRDAIATQVAPQGEHFYVYGENERLARPILFMAARDVSTEQEWVDWFAKLGAADPYESWNDI
ncbi:MAG: DUF2785 domain-containing protein, partial [Gammaproteobacteria bacterium]